MDVETRRCDDALRASKIAAVSRRFGLGSAFGPERVVVGFGAGLPTTHADTRRSRSDAIARSAREVVETMS